MARTRNLKPSFFTNELLAELPPLTRILYAGLWTIADREGRLEDRPKRIKAAILPFDDYTVTDGLKELASLGFIVRYECDHEQYIWVPKFTEHQYGLSKEPESQIPSPFAENSKITTRELPESSKRKLALYSILHTPYSSKSKCSSEPSQAKVSEPQSDDSLIVFDFPIRGKLKRWHLTKSKVAEYERTYPGLDVLGECRRARQWCIDNKEKQKTAQGMPAFLSRWLTRACDRPANERNGRPADSIFTEENDPLNDDAKKRFLAKGTP